MPIDARQLRETLPEMPIDARQLREGRTSFKADFPREPLGGPPR